MREIKFRVWDKKTKLMLSYDENPDNNLFVPCCDYNYDYAEYLQCTGLKDCNDIEIFEGDIVENNGAYSFILPKVPNKDIKNLIVVKNETGFMLVTPINYKNDFSYNAFGNIDNYSFWNFHRRLKVLGNIYENPELLEGV